MDTQHFALHQWVDQYVLSLKKINTASNKSERMTNTLEKSLFYRYMEYFMGNILPEYVKPH